MVHVAIAAAEAGVDAEITTSHLPARSDDQRRSEDRRCVIAHEATRRRGSARSCRCARNLLLPSGGADSAGGRLGYALSMRRWDYPGPTRISRALLIRDVEAAMLSDCPMSEGCPKPNSLNHVNWRSCPRMRRLAVMSTSDCRNPIAGCG